VNNGKKSDLVDVKFFDGENEVKIKGLGKEMRLKVCIELLN